MFESFALWLESRGSPRRTALLGARFAFSLYTLIAVTSVAVLLAVIAEVSLMDWISSHGWSIWIVAIVIYLAHWRIGHKLSTRRQSFECARPSLRLWYWYVAPVLVLLVVSTALAIAYSTR
jgi:hypothetical protein